MLLTLLSASVIVLAILIGYIVNQNPYLLNKRLDISEESRKKYHVFDHHPLIDDTLKTHSSMFGDDLNPYRNHCLRVLTYTNFFLQQSKMQLLKEQDGDNKAIDLMATAIAYHDIALWSDHKLNYLEPSAKQLIANSKQYNEEELEIMQEIILQHHKITEYTAKDVKINSGNYYTKEEIAIIVEAVRKADWTDFTMGIRRFGIPVELLQIAFDKLPRLHFQEMLMGMPKRLSPDNIIGGNIDVLKIYKW